jgi:predicted DNA-binding protein
MIRYIVVHCIRRSDDMPTSVRLDAETEQKLEEIAKSLERSKGWIIREAIRHYADEVADYEIALERLTDPNAKLIDHDEVKRVLNLVD